MGFSSVVVQVFQLAWLLLPLLLLPLLLLPLLLLPLLLLLLLLLLPLLLLLLVVSALFGITGWALGGCMMGEGHKHGLGVAPIGCRQSAIGYLSGGRLSAETLTWIWDGNQGWRGSQW